MRAAEIIAALPDLPPDIARAIQDLDARAYGRNEQPTLNQGQLFMRLIAACKNAGSDAAFARQVGVSKQYLADVLMSRRPISGRILRALRLREVTVRAFAPLDI